MKKSNTAPSVRTDATSTTKEFGKRVHSEPQTIRAGYCRDGHYLGLKPVKLPNGKLLWETAAIDQLVAGEVQ